MYIYTYIHTFIHTTKSPVTPAERCWSSEQNSSPLDTVHNRFKYVGDH